MFDAGGAKVVVQCQRLGCEAEETIPVDSPGWKVVDLVEHDPDCAGWGWDQSGFDLVLHCPEHRS